MDKRDRFDVYKELCAAADRGEYSKCKELLKELKAYILIDIWKAKAAEGTFLTGEENDFN